jgi:hypothetical protein
MRQNLSLPVVDFFFASLIVKMMMKMLKPEMEPVPATGDRPFRSGPGLNFVPAGLPLDRS